MNRPAPRRQRCATAFFIVVIAIAGVEVVGLLLLGTAAGIVASARYLGFIH